jgi:ubiquinone/menaquinone biosynthesis C-methylase UbiE
MHMFRESVKGKKTLTFKALQAHFITELDSEDMEYGIYLLKENGLIEKTQRDIGQDYNLTREGVIIGYNLCEYELQVVTSDIFSSYEPVKKLGIVESSLVLDIGCGAGQTLVAICRSVRPYLAIGVDIEKSNLLFAHDQASSYLKQPHRCSWLAASAQDLPFQKNSFTHIIFRQALYLVDGKKAMAELSRALRPRGIAYIRVPSYRHAFGYFKRQGMQNIARGLFVVLNGLVFHFLFRQFRVYFKSKSILYCEMFYTRKAIKNLCNRYGLDVEFVPTPKGKGGLMVLATKR